MSKKLLSVSQIAALAALFERAQAASEAQFLVLLHDLAKVLDDVTKPKAKHVDMQLADFIDAAAKLLPQLLADNTAQLVAFPPAAARFAEAMKGVMETVANATKD